MENVDDIGPIIIVPNENDSVCKIAKRMVKISTLGYYVFCEYNGIMLFSNGNVSSMQIVEGYHIRLEKKSSNIECINDEMSLVLTDKKVG